MDVPYHEWTSCHDFPQDKYFFLWSPNLGWLHPTFMHQMITLAPGLAASCIHAPPLDCSPKLDAPSFNGTSSHSSLHIFSCSFLGWLHSPPMFFLPCIPKLAATFTHAVSNRASQRLITLRTHATPAGDSPASSS